MVEAKKCRFCGEWLDEKNNAAVSNTYPIIETIVIDATLPQSEVK